MDAGGCRGALGGSDGTRRREEDSFSFPPTFFPRFLYPRFATPAPILPTTAYFIPFPLPSLSLSLPLSLSRASSLFGLGIRVARPLYSLRPFNSIATLFIRWRMSSEDGTRPWNVTHQRYARDQLRLPIDVSLFPGLIF